MSELPLVIAGGGIGGLATALACAKRKISTRVLERSAQPEAAGAGIQIPPNAGRILDELGLGDQLAAASACPEAIEIRDRRGRTLAVMELGQSFRDRYGAAYRTLHRADLLRILTAAIEAEPATTLTVACSIARFESNGAQVKIFAKDDAGTEEILAAGLVAADGIGSVVRTVLGGPSAAVAHYDAWRTVLTKGDWPRALPQDRVVLWLGARRHVVHYPVRSGSEFNAVVVVPAGAPDIAAVAGGFDGWAEPIRELIAAGSGWHRSPIRTMAPFYRPANDVPVALLGDAAHAMAPFVAQGGAMAIEDAAVIAECIDAAGADVAAAFDRYARLRLHRVARVQRTAARVGAIYHLPWPAGLGRDVAIRLLGGRALQQRYDWIYRFRP